MVTLMRASSIATAKTWWSMWRLKDGTCPVPFVGCGCVSVCLLMMAEEKPKTVSANTRNRTEYLAPETSCAFYGRVSTATRLVDPFVLFSWATPPPHRRASSPLFPIPCLSSWPDPQTSPHAPRLLRYVPLSDLSASSNISASGRAAALRETCDHVGRRQWDDEPNPGIGRGPCSAELARTQYLVVPAVRPSSHPSTRS